MRQNHYFCEISIGYIAPGSVKNNSSFTYTHFWIIKNISLTGTVFDELICPLFTRNCDASQTVNELFQSKEMLVLEQVTVNFVKCEY